jgi:hypothetical protein
LGNNDDPRTIKRQTEDGKQERWRFKEPIQSQRAGGWKEHVLWIRIRRYLLDRSRHLQ